MKPKTIGVASLGCAKNLVDTEVMLGHLEAAGCDLVHDPDRADVIVVNTCAFIEEAREESIRAILDALERKRDGRATRVVVAGCMVQRYRDELARELGDEVDAFVGLDELERIVPAAGAGRAPKSDLPLVGVHSRQSTVDSTVNCELSTVNRSRYLYSSRTPRKLATPPWTAYVKIAEGCDHTCAFCAIPAFRGAFRSRPADDVVREAERLAASGVREINLIAQDSSHYGRDRNDRGGLAGLLRRLDAVPGLRWIRVHYLYPNTVDDRLIDAMGSLPRVVPYVDIPLQHAHPATLRRMRRGGDATSHARLLERFRRAMPEAAVRTTLIVGFPGETEEEFDTLAAFVRDQRFDHLGVFAYSHETSTSAYALSDDVPPGVKEARRARLMEIQRGIAAAKNEARVGATEEVLVEGAHAETEHLLVGRTARQAAEVDGQVLINDGFVREADGDDPRLAPHARPGSFARVTFTETAGYDLVGRIVGAA